MGEPQGADDLDPEAIGQAQQLWARTEVLTSALAGELAEQLRMLLEPTLASRLAGDYRTGKRINMKRVIPYIASGFRKDRIWMRRTRPDKRKYQVVLAVDDSRSMRESGCAKFALESLGLIARAMGRLEVGEVGVVSFGGAGSARELHPLGKPFTEAAGAEVVARLGFSQDNTIADRPMVELMTFLDVLLEQAAVRCGWADRRNVKCSLSAVTSSCPSLLSFAPSSAELPPLSQPSSSWCSFSRMAGSTRRR